MFTIAFTPKSKEQYDCLKTDASQEAHYKAVKKTIELLAENPRHRSLETQEFHGLKAPNKEKVFEAYAQQNTPAAYRVFWCYGPEKAQTTILLISPHPQWRLTGIDIGGTTIEKYLYCPVYRIAASPIEGGWGGSMTPRLLNEDNKFKNRQVMYVVRPVN